MWRTEQQKADQELDILINALIPSLIRLRQGNHELEARMELCGQIIKQTKIKLKRDGSVCFCCCCCRLFFIFFETGSFGACPGMLAIVDQAGLELKEMAPKCCI